MEYKDFDCDCWRMPNMMGHGYDMMQCPYMRSLYSRNKQCPFAEEFEDEEPFDYGMPFLMPRIIGVDIDELF